MRAELREEHAAEGKDGADREVDAGDDDRAQNADRNDRSYRRLPHHVVDVVLGQEVGRRDRQNDPQGNREGHDIGLNRQSTDQHTHGILEGADRKCDARRARSLRRTEKGRNGVAVPAVRSRAASLR